MKKYIGTKLIAARLMDRATYNWYRGWDLSSDEEGTDEGYLVEYLDGGASNHKDHEGYISWSPIEVFDKSYRRTTGISFGLALESLKLGKRVARKGWNGKGIFIELQMPDNHSKMTSPYIFIDTTGLQTDNEAAPKSLVPWLASQTDMLSDDWEIIK